MSVTYAWEKGGREEDKVWVISHSGRNFYLKQKCTLKQTGM